MIGCSAGGILALKELFGGLTKTLSCPIVVVIHRLKNVQSKLEDVLQNSSLCPIKEAIDKEPLEPNTIYLAPSDYHLLVERDQTFSLSASEKINFSRPSIDVTFTSVAEAYGARATGVVLTGANRDGANGLRIISQLGGKAIVQNPEEAHVDVMPRSALLLSPDARQLKLSEIGEYLNTEFGV